jgi:hypothetical protein
MFSPSKKTKRNVDGKNTKKKEPEKTIMLIAIQRCHCPQKPGHSATQPLTHMRLLISMLMWSSHVAQTQFGFSLLVKITGPHSCCESGAGG